MAASDYLNDVQFRFNKESIHGMGYPQLEHEVTAHKAGRTVGILSWHPTTGEIGWVNTEEERQGVASRMFEFANQVASSQKLVMPRHSNDLSKSGEAWSNKVGGNRIG